ncbi:hypothetical protein E2562_033657 [Oryza meyeriana var. granulata]|uniref:Uncharacterized protein n=1 Tax=Oryza meyeriana var. granulata TaxID=110450 RepID=A0A6G1CAI2_9ORYZ|nr:hypothetical protein E2562_033657 [Oryza meyeriana var. granulata]
MAAAGWATGGRAQEQGVTAKLVCDGREAPAAESHASSGFDGSLSPSSMSGVGGQAGVDGHGCEEIRQRLVPVACTACVSSMAISNAK